MGLIYFFPVFFLRLFFCCHCISRREMFLFFGFGQFFKKRKSAKPISAVFIWDLYYPSRERCTTLIISMYIYSHCADPALPPLPASYPPPLLGFPLSLSTLYIISYHIYMDRTGSLCTDLNFGLILARGGKKNRLPGGNKYLNTSDCGGGGRCCRPGGCGSAGRAGSAALALANGKLLPLLCQNTETTTKDFN